MKKSYLIRTFAVLGLVGAFVFAIDSCKKNVESIELLQDPTATAITPADSVYVTVLNSSTSTSLTDADVTLKDPLGTTTPVKFVNGVLAMKVSTSGDYTLVAKKENFLDATKTFTISLTSGQSSKTNVSLVLVPIVKTTSAVNLVSGTQFTVATNNVVTVSPGEEVTVPTSTGTEVKTDNVNITASYYSSETCKDPSTDVYVAGQPDEDGGKVLKSIVFEPSGAKFKKGIEVKVYIGDVIAGLDEKTAKSIASEITLSNNGEAIAQSTPYESGDYVYFKINHFSRFHLRLPLKVEKVGEGYSDWYTITSACNKPVAYNGYFRIAYNQGTMISLFQLGRGNLPLVYYVRNTIKKDVFAGIRWQIKWRVKTNKYNLYFYNWYKKDQKVLITSFETYTGASQILYGFLSCHNQGGAE